MRSSRAGRRDSPIRRAGDRWDLYTNVRAYRIYDGADAVHRTVIARAAFESVDAGETVLVSRFGEPKTRPRE